MILPRTVHADATRETTKYVFWKSNVIEAARVTVEQAKPYADKLNLWFNAGEPVWMAAETLAFIVKQRAISERAMGSEIESMHRATGRRSGHGWSTRRPSMARHRIRKRYGRTTSPTYGKIDPPRRLQIQFSGSSYFKPGSHAYAIGFDTRGGIHCLDTHGPSAKGELCYLVSKSKHARGGALWVTPNGVRFTGRS